VAAGGCHRLFLQPHQRHRTCQPLAGVGILGV